MRLTSNKFYILGPESNEQRCCDLKEFFSFEPCIDRLQGGGISICLSLAPEIILAFLLSRDMINLGS